MILVCCNASFSARPYVTHDRRENGALEGIDKARKLEVHHDTSTLERKDIYKSNTLFMFSIGH